MIITLIIVRHSQMLVGLFIKLHWYTCYWYLLAYLQIPNDKLPNYINTWLPVNLRIVGDGPMLPGNIEIGTEYIV